MKKVSIIGATGFGGLGLIEILLRHPEFEINQLVARKDVGKKISEVFAHLEGHCEQIVIAPEDVNLNDTDLCFFSTPVRAGMTLIHEYYKKGIPVIDFSGDFRFNSVDDYKIYAENKGMETEHLASDLISESVYGLPEKNKEAIKNSRIIGNPGCFAIAMILGLLPAVKEDILAPSTITCNGITGVSGAGKNSGEINLYPQRHDNMNTYREGKHQHLVEVENILNKENKGNINILFIPHIAPVNRGILITSTAFLKKNTTTDEVQKLYKDYYKDAPFVLITSRSPQTANVRGSNRCEIRPVVDERSGVFYVTSVIDNLLKGQSGNAVQNANIMFGFNETLGIDIPAFYP
jgi:N-acetyl-gamma-glutamyl-phosphate reductase